MKTLRLGIAGVGLIGRAHWEHIRALDGCELAAFADPSPQAAALARDAGVPLHADLSSLLRTEQLDGVILATPNALHVPGAMECIEARMPALVEKPVAETVADAQRLAAAVQASGVPVLVGHHRRHSAILERARALIAAGTLGRLVAVNGSATYYKPDSYYEAGPWRKQLGGGPILINLIHEIDNLRVLVGEITEVQAFASNATRGFAVEDTVAINLRFANGALGTFILCDSAASPRSWEQTSHENKSYDHHGDEDCYIIAGTRGSLQVPTMRLFRYPAEASWWQPLARETLAVPEIDPLAQQLAHFCAVIRGEAAPCVPVADAARTLAVTLAVAAAARSGRPVAIAPGQ